MLQENNNSTHQKGLHMRISVSKTVMRMMFKQNVLIVNLNMVNFSICANVRTRLSRCTALGGLRFVPSVIVVSNGTKSLILVSCKFLLRFAFHYDRMAVN